MTALDTTRRGLLRLGTGALAYGVGAAGVTTAAFADTQAHGAELPSVSPDLVSLIAEYDAQDAAYDRWVVEVHNPAVEREEAMVAAIPHITIDGGLSLTGGRIVR